MFSVFRQMEDSDGVISINYVKNGKNVNRNYYASELRLLEEALK